MVVIKRKIKRKGRVKEEIVRIVKQHPGINPTQIAKIIKISDMTARSYLNELEAEGVLKSKNNESPLKPHSWWWKL